MSDNSNPHIIQVRQLMLEQLRALRTAAAGDDLATELKRSKGVSELASVMIDSARVEVEYLAVIEGDGEVPFLAAPDDGGAKKPSLPYAPLTAGPSAGHPWSTSVHKLKG
jgi:type 1 glutamine amidotransferase